MSTAQQKEVGQRRDKPRGVKVEELFLLQAFWTGSCQAFRRVAAEVAVDLLPVCHRDGHARCDGPVHVVCCVTRPGMARCLAGDTGAHGGISTGNRYRQLAGHAYCHAAAVAAAPVLTTLPCAS